MTPALMYTGFVNVFNDCVEYGGYTPLGINGYHYRISNNKLFIIPEVHWGEYFEIELYLHIIIKDRKITDITEVYIGDEDDERKYLVWDINTGSLAEEEDRVFMVEKLGIKPHF